jgi:tRNA pseudouridine38-40 synthase
MPATKLILEYDGTRYRGWQEQSNARSVAGELRRAAESVLGVPVELVGSGRTDAGVHALAQVAHLKHHGPRIPAVRFRESLNDLLPADIHVLAAEAAGERFHARHNARSRSYLYQIALRRTAFAKRFVWWVRDPLDVKRMSESASGFVGRHDFAAFCERPTEQSSTLVEVEAVQVLPQDDLILLRVVASHFLWKMVRRLVGTLVELGRGTIGEEDVRRLLEGAAGHGSDRLFDPARHTAPPSGLFLEAVLYPNDAALPALRPAFPVRASGRR